MVFAFFISFVLVLLGGFTIRKQLRSLSRLRAQQFMASDDRAYLRSQAWRRIINSVFLLILAGMLAGAYLSGLETSIDQLDVKREDGQIQISPEQRQLARFYYAYWIIVLILLFLVVSLAVVDIWSTRRYAWQQLRRIQSENRAMLERDLAMYRQQKINDRMRKAD